MSENTQHTPLPWRTLDTGNEIQITTANHWRKIAVTTWEPVTAEDRANASYIVRACNSHEALVSALSALVSECQSRFDYESTRAENAALEQAVSALAQAEANT